ncbi:CoA ester lyase [Rhodobacteraceae bacterium 63075]|nr:CoA ester lyase [Rhodobacteraceae bacterium 63075]
MDTPRSWLFVPGDCEGMMQKALASGADALILDLEDAVSLEAKPAARASVARFLNSARTLPCFVRVNALDTGMTGNDIAALAVPPDGFVLPKCEGPADLERLSAMTNNLPILAIATETVKAVRALFTDDWSHPNLFGMAWGGEDLAADLGASANRDALGGYLGPFAMARDAMLFAAKAAGVAAIDAVHTDFRVLTGLTGEARSAAAVGFTGKLAIHPAQIAPIHDAFTPTAEMVDWAKQVIAAMEEADGGIARLRGQMLDKPHLDRARTILRRATKH